MFAEEMLSSFTIKNYKSIVDLTLELGHFNVFIGEHGAGKTNILEALAMAAGAATQRLTNEDMVARGVRVARSVMTFNAFADHPVADTVELVLRAPNDDPETRFELSHQEGAWVELEGKAELSLMLLTVDRLSEGHVDRMDIEFLDELSMQMRAQTRRSRWRAALRDYGIYCADTLALRGLQVESHREPLGLYGEALDVVIAQLPEEIRQRITDYARVITWFEGLDVDREGRRKLEGHKPGRSRSDLYFVDRFLTEQDRLFSAENANEGILHLLMYLVLFLAPQNSAPLRHRQHRDRPQPAPPSPPREDPRAARQGAGPSGPGHDPQPRGA